MHVDANQGSEHKPRLLIVDDDETIRSQMKWAFAPDYDLAFAWDAKSLMKQVDAFEPAVVALDLGLPPDPRNASEGLRLLREILKQHPSCQVIVITGNPDKENALKAIDFGATDFYAKPVDLDELAVSVRRAAHIHQLETEIQSARESSARELGRMVGQSPQMTALYDLVRRVAPSDEPVLISGESGTGKELVARAIHQESLRAGRPFVVVNCGSIPETLMEGELFGHEAGAFTDAKRQRLGLVEQAAGGTLFLDEIGELPPSMQPKLLRFLQSGAVQRLGSGAEFSVDVRVVAATNRHLEAEVSQGTFREDLYYRLKVVHLQVPPLRARRDDITLLADHFLRQVEKNAGRGRLTFAEGALGLLSEYDWPGNVRELENRIRSAGVVATDGQISLKDLDLVDKDLRFRSLKEVREEVEREQIRLALSIHGGNITRAAQSLKVSRPTLHALISKLAIHAD